MLNLFVTSINKKDGKTFLTAGLAATMQSLGYSTTVYKPIQTNGIEKDGFMQSPDLTYIKSIDPYISTHFTYLFKNQLDPLINSEMENCPIDIDLIHRDYSKITGCSECTIVDSDGGIMSPIAQNLHIAELVKKLQVPLLFVATPNYNTTNNLLASLYVAHEMELDIRGVVINNVKKDCPKVLLNSIQRIIEEYTNTRILGILPYLGNKIAPEDLISNILNSIDIESILNLKIEKLKL